MSKADEPAFPIITPLGSVIHDGGLTKREYFAAMAMQGMLAGHDYPFALDEIAEASDLCVAYADGLLRALERKPE